MDRLIFAAIADDDTGATDLAGMLTKQALRTLLVIDLPTMHQFIKWSAGYQAVVMAEGTRNISPAAAGERTRQALRIVKAREPRVFQIKYCSTFDSTPAGNIGASLDAALDELDEEFTIAVPALPINGRTTYQGYQFVHHQLLSDSAMRDHPLTPMAQPNLVALLGQQTKRRVGLAPFAQVEAGAEQLKRCFQSLREQEVAVAIVDCLHERHLETISQAASDLRLFSGSSALAIKMPVIWRERGWLSDQTDGGTVRCAANNEAGCLIVAGSCSVATRAQNEWLIAQGTPVANLNAQALLTGKFDKSSLIAETRAHLSAGQHYLLTISAPPAEVRQVQQWAEGEGLTISALGEALAHALAGLVLEILQAQSISGLIVAGGETSGAVCRRLELGALHVGRNIEPGVPLCFSLGKFQLPTVLKSGNFGSDDFYGQALRAIAQFTEHVRSHS